MLKEQSWEKLLGPDAFSRTVNLGRDARSYREWTNNQTDNSHANKQIIALHSRQLQVLGKNLEDIKWVDPPKQRRPKYSTRPAMSIHLLDATLRQKSTCPPSTREQRRFQ